MAKRPPPLRPTRAGVRRRVSNRNCGIASGYGHRGRRLLGVAQETLEPHVLDPFPSPRRTAAAVTLGEIDEVGSPFMTQSCPSKYRWTIRSAVRVASAWVVSVGLAPPSEFGNAELSATKSRRTARASAYSSRMESDDRAPIRRVEWIAPSTGGQFVRNVAAARGGRARRARAVTHLDQQRAERPVSGSDVPRRPLQQQQPRCLLDRAKCSRIPRQLRLASD